MINSLKTIAFFGCSLTGRYRRTLSEAFNTAAEELGVNMVYFNFLGKIGNKNAMYGIFEADLIDYIDLTQFDGIIYDGEGYNVEGMAEQIIEKLRRSGVPVVSISNEVEGFYNIKFDDARGIRSLIEHFIDVHHITKIGFMSGTHSHPDAQARLKVFRETMRDHGLPEDGCGVYEGDFWFHRGEQAADYFFSVPERPEAIVCANDYMAIALITALKRRGINVPGDIAVSGFDGSEEGKDFLPHITTATRERLEIARRSLRMLLELSEGKKPDEDFYIVPKPVVSQSCGCMKLDYRQEAEGVNSIYEINRRWSYSLYDTESQMLKLNQLTDVKQLQDVFVECSSDFEPYQTYFAMMHADRDGRPSYDSDFIAPTGEFIPVMWIDKTDEHEKPDKNGFVQGLIPRTKIDTPHFYYIMSLHCPERMFGYVVIRMSSNRIFNEFYNVSLLNMATTLETFLKNDRISKLIGTLEDLSIRDSLTGMLNRRGFDEMSKDMMHSLDEKHLICTMVLDMDGLKHINDDYGHYEGDRAIKALANIITKCCDSGEVCARTGGDEFYIFATDYSQKKLDRFIERLNNFVESYNKSYSKAYDLAVSYGTYLTEADKNSKFDDLLKVSDTRMYEQKMTKPNRRK